MTGAALDSTRCPLCGGPNACGIAAGATECWCFTATISPAALAALPEEARGVVCVCATCAERGPTPQRTLKIAKATGLR